MAHIEDRWYKTIKHPGGRTERVKSELFGKGLRYRVRYVGPDGRERKKSFPDRAKRDAEAFLVSTESDKLRGAYVDPAAGRITFREYAEEWLRTRSFDESTRESTEIRVRKHILPYFGHRSLASIMPGHVRAWDASLVGKIAVTTRSVVFAHLRTILGAAVDDERIAKNPCSARSVKAPRPAERRVVPWTADQVSAIRSGLASRYRPMVNLGAGCGLRQGEIFGIGVDDLDLDAGWVHVVRQVKRVRSRLVFGLPKNDRDRRVPLPASAVRVLREHLAVVKPVTITLPWEDPFTGDPVAVPLLFTTTRGNALNRATFDGKSWQPAVEAAGIVPTRATGMHALRHFYASVLLDAGESVKTLATYLGHADPGFTLRVYTHLMPAGEERTRRAIDALFGDDAGKVDDGVDGRDGDDGGDVSDDPDAL
ncbi:site-specific integrase [Solwaraspora sp. WMMA2080]|uniref:tyrosine-type recombinase/integrase n=1 Tax=unclassified Solwaraspora TaxID=2627926 RepID=UPI00248C4994|nr:MULTISPECIES: site-specific integrase [unclassified Solwaraspora]WBB95212.1 site-specific integrase [Solwaraspora sp. WMMA2059]WBC20882.1 site-specific integrase [Solwaraspora sp. WMMA2080]